MYLTVPISANSDLSQRRSVLQVVGHADERVRSSHFARLGLMFFDDVMSLGAGRRLKNKTVLWLE
jgi:hypothetical protein